MKKLQGLTDPACLARSDSPLLVSLATRTANQRALAGAKRAAIGMSRHVWDSAAEHLLPHMGDEYYAIVANRPPHLAHSQTLPSGLGGPRRLGFADPAGACPNPRHHPHRR